VSAASGRTPGPLRSLALAVACAVTVSVVYLPQSLLPSIAADLGVSHGLASVLSATTQVGYAIGILLLVPLAARIPVKTQVFAQTCALGGTLLLATLVPNLATAVAVFLAIGFVANISQVIIPAANRMSSPERRGSTNSVLVGSLLVGTFGGRALFSVCTEWIGWRATVFAAAAVVVGTVPTTYWALRATPPPEGGGSSHRRLVADTLRQAAANPILVRSALTQACVLATFNALWTVMALHLTGPTLSWTLGQAGLFGLVGLVAGVFTPSAGRLIDRYGAGRMTGWFLVVLVAAMAAILPTNGTPAIFGVVMFVATWANQAALSGNQVRALATDPDRSARLNTAFSFIVFLGGGIGGLLGPIMYAWRGIDAVAATSVAVIIVAIAQWRLIPRSLSEHRASLQKTHRPVRILHRLTKRAIDS
jgi:predicted MFS family arabinose efflux permease